MNIFFDVDYTILGLDYSLRPGTAETFQQLIDDGNLIHIWSGVGLRNQVVRDHKLEPFVTGVYHKPLYRMEERLEELGVPLVPDFVIDDHLEIVTTFGGVYVTPYFFGNGADSQMERIYNIVSEYAQRGHSDDRQYRAKGSDARH